MAAEDVQKLSDMLPWIRDMLRSAEERRQVNGDVRLWFAELKEIEREADDVVDEFMAKSARRQARRQGTYCSHLPSSFNYFCQIPSRHRMGREIKIIRKKWEELRQKIPNLKFVSRDPGAVNFDGISLSSRPESNSMFADKDFFGREEDKDCLRKKLLAGVVGNSTEEPSSSSATYSPMGASILSIVAMGGMGKTALAQVVYNDIQSYFPLHKWLFVGEHFNPKSLIQKILGEQQGERSLDEPEEDLIRVVQDRMFLFVLDDVWYDQPRMLKDFLNLLKHFGCRGSKVLVTTRSLAVARAIGNYENVYQLKPLADENCWSIFAKHAFPSGDSIHQHPHLEEIGRDMVKNLKGVPLAAKIMGSMLGNTNSLEEQRHMLDDLIEQVVGLSYWQLPSYLKQCAAYCAMFPKSFQFEKMRLVQMWMAQGFLEYPTMIGGGRMEDIGSYCFEYLLRESFFQLGELAEDLDDVRQDYTADGEQTYVMHDIIHSFMQSVSHAECWFTGEKNLGIPEKPCHMSFCCATTNSAALAGLSGNFPKLRSLVHSCGSSFISFREFPLTQGCFIRNLPDSVGELIHLRYLDLTHTGLDRLSESLCNLHNLQTLRWADGFDLPKGTSKLVNLRCLDGMLVHSFPRIGRLTALQKLDQFKVGKECGYKIEELADMTQLRGKLSIMNLENVIGGRRGAASVRLRDKRYLRSLELEWSPWVARHGDGDLEVLLGLEPHPDLEDIQIRNNMGGRPPFWMGGGCLSNLMSVTLDHCLLWSSLPSLGALRHLRSLLIKDMRAVKAVGHEFYSVDEFGSTEEPPFPRLEVLVFADMTEWEEWSIPESSPPGRPPFPILRVLRMTDCPKLRALPPIPPSVVELEIVGVGLGGGILSVNVGEAISSEPCHD